ncbi:MAG: hypothetical protein RLZZ324_984 [Candidatus Parcubacteria bacterium]
MSTKRQRTETKRIRSPRISQTSEEGWKSKKSPHAVAFVAEAHAHLERCDDAVDRSRLETAIEQFSFGTHDLQQPLTVEHFLIHGMPAQ